MRPVIKVSGSLFQASLDPRSILPFIDVIKGVYEEGSRPIIVTGGGEVARNYITAARTLGADESSLDEIGIDISRLNARLFIARLMDVAYPLVPRSLEEVLQAYQTGRIVVCGGLNPGQSTNATAALIGERMRSDLFINTTDVEGVFTKDPRVGSGALLDSINPERLFELLTHDDMRAGGYDLLDFVALKVLQRSKIPTKIVKCSVEALEAALRGRKVGTDIIV